MKDMTISELHQELRAPEFHSYSVQLVGPAPDFNGEPGIEFRVILGTNDSPREIEDILIAALEKELYN